MTATAQLGEGLGSVSRPRTKALPVKAAAALLASGALAFGVVTALGGTHRARTEAPASGSYYTLTKSGVPTEDSGLPLAKPGLPVYK
jgi:hypothetical protein